MKDLSKSGYPKFANLRNGGCILVLRRVDKSGYAEYYKVAGAWSIYARWRNGQLTCTNSPHPECYYMKGSVLFESTEKEFRENNRGWVDGWDREQYYNEKGMPVPPPDTKLVVKRTYSDGSIEEQVSESHEDQFEAPERSNSHSDSRDNRW